MKYKIGALAKRFGITTQALRFYEKEGLIASINPEESNMRKYYARTFKWLCSIRRYHDMGFATKEIKDLFRCERPEDILPFMNKKIIEIEKEISRLTLLSEAIEQQKVNISLIDELLYRCKIEESPAMLLLIDREGEELDESAEILQVLRQWFSYLPFICNASVIPQKALENIELELPLQSGYCIDDGMSKELGLFREEPVEFIPQRLCLRTVNVLNRPTMPYEERFGYIISYLDRQGLAVAGNGIGRCLATVKEGYSEQNHFPKEVYYEFWIPVKQRE